MNAEQTPYIEQHPLRIVRPKEAGRLLGVSVDTLNRLRKRPNFPKPVELSKSASRNAPIGFLLKDLESWIEQQAQETEGQPSD